ncbi:hypothetical protein B0T26DRAFT_193534 [Lasiosphaeria miniovina]|uniref:Uncharacterized protein n=1 Tax=Lasiosphaeria miniovina TaxID=1954250 RepID=A0AA40ATP9_9PEZI|nr:uncharacterized protein B0T26DRAFT_193534 [Lasiosphaeria miniovina]KAK0721830.1 hypothetical protein B0T26DRAFT_193534 [Lasiosphaeria miniovina]
MGQKQSLPVEATFFCPQTGVAVETPLGLCTECQAAHDLILQSVTVCPNTGYRISQTTSLRPHKECSSCFQVHQPFSKRVYICPVTGAQIPHPRDTGGRCQKCSRSHQDNSTPTSSREAVVSRGLR